MKRKITKLLSLVLVGSLSVMGLVGCGNAANTATTNGKIDAAPGAKIAGTVSLAGSTSMEKVCEALMEGFMEKYPDITVTTEYTGSGAGLESLNTGSVDIGNASRHVKEEEAAHEAANILGGVEKSFND